MTTIKIKEFFDYSEEDIYAFLKIHRRTFYQVVIPKEYSFTEHGDRFIHDYYRALYVGQLLERVSIEVLPSYPEEFDKGEFSFIVISSWQLSLARVIFEIIKGYNHEENEERCMAFEERAVHARGMLRKGEEWACPLYIAFIEQYLEEKGF
jgi:hypothetical protein